MPKCGFNKVPLQITLRRRFFPVNLLYIFGTSFVRTPLEGCFWHYAALLLFRLIVISRVLYIFLNWKQKIGRENYSGEFKK